MLSAVPRKLAFMDGTYGERLTEAMKLAELPEREGRAKLAAALKITVQAVGMVINGTTKAFKPAQSARAARFLQVDHFWLATGEGEPRPPLMTEGLTPEAIEVARKYDKLNEDEKRRLRVLLLAARDGLSDEEVEQFLPKAPVNQGS